MERTLFDQKSHSSQTVTALEQNGQCHKKDHSNGGLKANDKWSSTKPVLT